VAGWGKGQRPGLPQAGATPWVWEGGRSVGGDAALGHGLLDLFAEPASARTVGVATGTIFLRDTDGCGCDPDG
jgi:hypothetical protein